MKNIPQFIGKLMASRSFKNTIRFTFAGTMGALFLLSCSQEEIASIPSEEVAIEQPRLIPMPDPDEMIEIRDLIPLELKTTEAAGVDRGRYNITLRFVAPVTDRQKEVFDEAVARWERIIIADETSVTPEIPIPSFF